MLRKPSKETLLVILIMGSVIALGAANIIFLSDSSVVTAVAFEGQTQYSVFDGSLVVNAHYDDSRSMHTFVIYSESRDTSNVSLGLSDLYEVDSKRKFPSVDVVPENISSSNTVVPENTRVFSFSTNSINQPGLYQGSLFVKDGVDTASVPVEFDVKPPITKPMIIVVDGIAISIFLWKLIAYYNRMYSPAESGMKKIKADRTEENVDEKVRSRNRIQTGMGMSGAVHYAVYRNVFVKNLVLDVGTLIFGIGLALIGLPTNETVLNVRTLAELNILTLLGIGLGIGSLKEFLSRS